MRIAAISDIHGNIDGLEAVLSALAREKPDKLAILGDLAAFGPDPAEVLDRLIGMPDAEVIRGNTERFILEVKGPSKNYVWESAGWTRQRLGDAHLRYLESLPRSRSLACDGVTILLCHADPGSEDGGFFPDQEALWKEKLALAGEQVVLAGHTHCPLSSRVGDQLLVNTGSAGFPYDGDPRPSYAVIDIAAGRISDVRIGRVDYDTRPVSERLGRIGTPMAELMSRRVLVGKMLRS